ncbi:MAG: ribosomal protein S10 [Candidatus Xenolissoclinum pacificiensis L6]|uniref:Small ribosomal subunit protein uS10 n=1 Tax=Candidatus Xenolissoclinum pacificiensis L6 TaxID=1401685 RepID=W2UZP7_9RICK|nr:MAG: ribosomal protein S10 [Candidatus Xenolissoclinum pacificiensis L6]
MEKAVRKIIQSGRRGGATVVGPIPLPKTRKVFTVNRSPHVDKKSREQFEIFVSTRLIEFVNFDSHLTRSFAEWQLPSGVEAYIEVEDA